MEKQTKIDDRPGELTADVGGGESEELDAFVRRGLHGDTSRKPIGVHVAPDGRMRFFFE